MSAQRKYRPRAATAGQPVIAPSSGITWATPNRPKAIEYKTGEIRRTVIEVPEFTFATTAAAKGIGQAIYRLPSERVIPLAVKVELNSVTGGTTTGPAGEVGIGPTVATGAVAVLNGTPGFENILTGQTLANHVAQTELASDVAASAGIVPGEHPVIDGRAGDVDLHLNIASTFSGTGGVTASARVEILWVVF